MPKRRNEKLAALLEKSLKSQSQQHLRKRQSLLEVRGKWQSKKTRNLLPSSSSVANQPRTRSARVNLNERFALMDQLNEGTNANPATTSPNVSVSSQMKSNRLPNLNNFGMLFF